MERLPEGCVDLAFADPPFNIGYEYDVYNDRRDGSQYLDWTRRWGGALVRALKPAGTFWLAIGDEYAAELKLIFQNELGLTCRNWVVWYYTFGVHCAKKFSRSHAHLFYFVKDAGRFTFNDPAIRVPSARQLVYADARADARGRVPDDTWILRPQDLPDGFQSEEDTWYFPRVCGTFKERAGWHGCQMPEQLLGRIIRACSNPGEVVLDPFAGSGTTLAVAKKLGRRWLGFELSPEYAQQVQARLDGVAVGQPLEGAEEPLTSAPSTPAGRPLKSRRGRPKREPDQPLLFPSYSWRYNNFMLTLNPHPLLDLGAFVTVFPRPLGEIPSSPELRALFAGVAPAPLHTDDAVRETVRALLRQGGFKPTGRSKPASEYLLKAVREGTLAPINLAVDACNVASLHSGLPISVVDLDRARPPLRVGLAAAGSSYVFNASGQTIDLGGLLCLFDADGPCANAVKDAQRTKTTAETRRTLSLVWGTAALPGRAAQTAAWYRALLEQHGATTEPVGPASPGAP